MAEVSIILPVYNSEKYIKNTINSVLNQTYKDWELIIIDDASTDNSLKIINEFKIDSFRIIKNEMNLGAALSRNKGIKKANGRYIAFIDSDDLWNEDKLEKQIGFMKEQDLAISFSSYYRINESGNIIGKVEAPVSVNFEYILKNVVMQVSTVIIDTYKIKKDLILMPNLKTCEDVAMYLNILKTGINALGYQECLTKYMVRKKSLSSNKVLNTMRLWKTYRNLGISFKDRIKYIIKHVNNSIKRGISYNKIVRLKEIFNIINFRQIIDVFLFPFIYIISLFCKTFCKNIWIIEENPNEACDNGYVFFKYLRENRKDINVYYVINNKSKDYEKIKKLGNVINHRSIKHWIYYLNADKIIVTQKYANPSPAIFYILHKYNLLKIPRIFLQHGITKDDAKMYYFNKTKFRLFICGAKREYEYIKEKFGYPEKNIVFTGFARFDNLDISKKNNNVILIAPTWRKWIKTQKEFDMFIQNYYDILHNEEFIKMIEAKDIKVFFILHKNMKKFNLIQNVISDNIVINHNGEADIQELLNKADLLITDYSSLFMDIAYREKPIIYYQFDKLEFREKQLPEGYFSYEKDGFGDVLDDYKNVISKIKYYIDNNYEIEQKYLNKMACFFERRDKNNCKRILEEIEKI